MFIKGKELIKVHSGGKNNIAALHNANLETEIATNNYESMRTVE
jgi:hypothetical protein